MARDRRPLAACLLLAALWACAPTPDPGGSAATGAGAPGGGLPVASLRIDTGVGEVVFRVEVAETPEARATGLMGRRSLDPDSGMVFLFPGETESGFWMKDTLIPLSVAFWDRSDRIVAMLDMEPCREDPCPTYRPGVPYVGAVEVNPGALREHGVEIGHRVELER